MFQAAVRAIGKTDYFVMRKKNCLNREWFRSLNLMAIGIICRKTKRTGGTGTLKEVHLYFGRQFQLLERSSHYPKHDWFSCLFGS